jgi:hypothetical protein
LGWKFLITNDRVDNFSKDINMTKQLKKTKKEEKPILAPIVKWSFLTLVALLFIGSIFPVHTNSMVSVIFMTIAMVAGIAFVVGGLFLILSKAIFVIPI